ncbi:hypothetical protein [Cerasicoccus arenae]|uniref:PEP-CTERM sorting domain-containing protein n=1 Tax=Cerasicoccus arenae TaxID=424488 RepID=A0A8J3GDL4_9BACT|nr:hypothetical protein [Cerasicoccus arenae]MBK1858119.1 hypothetical protein [Cerasicoccus arenae]GHB96597.1 hypothetical protein GCM10007047_10620 [Cerasicoccus arenae]
MKTNHIKSIVLAPLLFVPVLTHATVLFTENFESYTPAQNVPTGGNWQALDPADILTAQTDSSNLFSTGNQYGQLSLINFSSNMIARATNFTGTLNGQFSMQFNDPSGEAHSGRGWSLRLGSGAGNSSTAFGVFIDDGNLFLSSGNGVDPNGGTITTYSKDVTNSLDIVFNNDNTIYNYAGGSVASHTMDVYLNGTLVGDDLAGAGGLATGVAIATFNYTAKADPFTGTLFVDNLNVNSVAVIPESSNYAILAGALGFLVVAYRRKRANQ